MRLRGLYPVAAGLVLIVLVAGCASVPTGGRVSSGRSADRAELVDDPYARLVPVGPGQNWGPDQIITGFVTASASFEDGHRVAREYLLGPGTQWRPDPRPAVTVYQDIRYNTVNQAATQAKVRVHGSQLGTIGSDGQYSSAPKNVEMIFHLARDRQKQWRIGQLPAELVNGLLLSRRDVDRAFRTLNLYFFAPDGQKVVPNAIFLPLVNRRQLAGQLVQALLAGPTAWLAPAVRNLIPKGTRLLGGVDISDGVATVNLSREARDGGLAEMSSQLMWTLRQLPEIQRMKLQIDGATESPPGVGSSQTIDDWQRNSPDGTANGQESAVFRGDGDHLHRLDSDHQSLRMMSVNSDRLHRPAASQGFSDVAGLTDDREAVLAGQPGSGAELRTVLRAREKGATFTAPSWDRMGALWVVESTGDRSWLWVRPPGRSRSPERVAAWGLDDNGIRALRIARDGVRAAAIVLEGGRAQIHIGRIVRKRDGRIASLSFLPISSDLAGATDLAWSDAGRLAVLGKVRSAPQVQPYLVPVSGGPPLQMGVENLAAPLSVAAAPNSPVLIGIKDEKGRAKICRQNSVHDRFSGWICDVDGADPAYAG